MFKPTDPTRYLKVFDPMLGVWHFFLQLGNLYGSSSGGKRWEKMFVAWLTSNSIDFVQGQNEKSAFYCKARGLRLLTHCDDLFVRGPRAQVKWFFAALAARASRDARNSREERVRNGLVAFARGSNG